MAKQLIKGNEAIVKGAILAGCRFYFGYPITPASEIAEAAAFYLPVVGGTFIQAESESAAINMLYGAASGGVRAMTASSSPGMSLKQEGISYAAGSELPMVIVDVMRGGPGLGNIAPAQADYNQMVKGGGHGGYKMVVLAPNSAQEMCDLTMLAFDVADKYRNPAVILADGFVGQMMEPVEFPEPVMELPKKEWAIQADAQDEFRLVSSIDLEPEELEKHNVHLQQKYAAMEANHVMFEDYQTEDAELVVIGYGVVSRILHSVVDELRGKGVKIGLMRPISLWPFPKNHIIELAARIKRFFVVELSDGQMVDDVRLAVNGKIPVQFYGRYGGVVPSPDEIIAQIMKKNEA
ncbi:MAG TPA: 3-methyl-2-oxobutanoate dehydrogenase subunit VorB [bacterium]|nr:3-methyl-2-oxobutanoate dehydrogenase subunit VorB [bacterium]HPN42359.1 3-methyl-2-oxobutanoate dehydrogenase subunit VorB [bacterium]